MGRDCYEAPGQRGAVLALSSAVLEDANISAAESGGSGIDTKEPCQSGDGCAAGCMDMHRLRARAHTYKVANETIFVKHLRAGLCTRIVLRQKHQ